MTIRCVADHARHVWDAIWPHGEDAMPIPPDFVDECLYAPEAWFIHDVLELDEEGGRVVAMLDTKQLNLIVPTQRQWPGHIRHLPGAIVIQMTGTLGQLHATYILGLRPTEGWVGFGTHIRNARFGNPGQIGPPVIAEGVCTRTRKIRGTYFVQYSFRFEQEGELLYQSDQTAAWFRTEHRGPLK